MKNAIAYIRISSKDQSTYSLDYQERLVRKYCTDNDLKLLELFKDNGESSYTFDRPDWKSLEAFIKKNKTVEYLIISDHDRFSRNLAEALMKIKELQDKFGIKVLATTDRIDTDMSDPSTYIMRAFKYMMAESELMRIRERTKAGILQAAISGYYTNKAPFGYINIRTEDKKPTLKIDKQKAEIIKKIFSLSKNGLAPEQIRRHVKDMGFTHGNKSAIQDILANPVYAGMVKVPAYKERPEYLTKGKHEGIISEADYWKVQNKGKTFNPQAKEEVPLRGVLKCWCGKPVTAGNSKSSTGKYYWYYLCNEHRENMSAVKLHKHLGEVLDQMSFSPDDVEWFRDRLSYKIGAMLQTRAEDMGAASKDLKDINRKIKATEEKYLSNADISPESYKKVIGNLKVEKSIIENKVRELSNTSKDYMAALELLLPKLSNLKHAYDDMSLDRKQEFLKLIFGENLEYTKQTYRTNFIHPFFEHNELTLKDKGLLIKEKPIRKIGTKVPSMTWQTSIELIEELAELFRTA